MRCRSGNASEKTTGFLRCLSRFLRRDERGSATLEFVIWVPLFAFLLMITVDASFMYMSMTRMENAARDAARRVAIGQFGKVEIVVFVLQELPDAPYTVSADCSTAESACVSITQTVESMTAFGILKQFLGNTLGAEVKMRLEPGVTLSAAPMSRPTTCEAHFNCSNGVPAIGSV